MHDQVCVLLNGNMVEGTKSRPQIPLNYKIDRGDGMVTQPWAFWLKQLVDNMPPAGAGYVIDGSNSTYVPMVIFQGPDSNKGSTPINGSIYYALDTGKIYVAHNSAWDEQTSMLVGDVTKSAHSNVTTLKTVNQSVGTWGDSNNVPVMTVDAKGRVTSISMVPVSAKVRPAGPEGALQFNLDGALGASSQFLFDLLNQQLKLGAGASITFANPLPTFNNLSPLTTKGDILTRTTSNNVRHPIGASNSVLQVDTESADGLSWRDRGIIEVPFNFGDATPKYLMTIPANKVIFKVQVIILTKFTDSTNYILLGTPEESDILFSREDSNVLDIGVYESMPGIKYGTDTALILTIYPGASTAGSGIVKITYQQ